MDEDASKKLTQSSFTLERGKRSTEEGEEESNGDVEETGEGDES
jgi:hypothetical protein